MLFTSSPCSCHSLHYLGHPQLIQVLNPSGHLFGELRNQAGLPNACGPTAKCLWSQWQALGTVVSLTFQGLLTGDPKFGFSP